MMIIQARRPKVLQIAIHGRIHQGEIISLIERILCSRARVSLFVIERLFANKIFRKIFSFEKFKAAALLT